MDVFQNSREDASFSCICSFKRPERNQRSVRIVQKANHREKYGGFITEKKPENWPEAPTVDSPWYAFYTLTWFASGAADNIGKGSGDICQRKMILQMIFLGSALEK